MHKVVFSPQKGVLLRKGVSRKVLRVLEHPPPRAGSRGGGVYGDCNPLLSGESVQCIEKPKF